MNVAENLVRSANLRPDHTAIRFQDQTISYSELNRAVDRLAHGLTLAGLRPNDLCVLMMPNSIQWVTVSQGEAVSQRRTIPFLLERKRVDTLPCL